MADIDWGAVIEGLGGGLRGGAEAYGNIQAQRRREDEDEVRRQERADALALRRQEIEERMRQTEATTARQGAADAGQVVDRARSVYGTDQDLPASVNEAATRAGRSNEVQRQVTVDPVQTAMSALGQSPIGPLPMPSVSSRFVPTAAQREQQQTAQAMRDLATKIGQTNAPAGQALAAGVVTGKVPTLGPDAFAPPVDPAVADKAKRDAAFDDFTRREDYRREHKPPTGGPPVRKDNPRLPSGVKAYLGQIIQKYPGNRAAAEDELRRATPSLIDAHPDLDLALLDRQFEAVFPKPAAGSSSPFFSPGGGAPGGGGAPPVVQAQPAPSSADASPGQVQAAKAALAAAIKSRDPQKIAALRAQLATLAGR